MCGTFDGVDFLTELDAVRQKLQWLLLIVSHWAQPDRLTYSFIYHSQLQEFLFQFQLL